MSQTIPPPTLIPEPTAADRALDLFDDYLAWSEHEGNEDVCGYIRLAMEKLHRKYEDSSVGEAVTTLFKFLGWSSGGLGSAAIEIVNQCHAERQRADAAETLLEGAGRRIAELEAALKPLAKEQFIPSIAYSEAVRHAAALLQEDRSHDAGK